LHFCCVIADVPFADNLVYSGRNYTAPGFGSGKYPGYFDSPEGMVYWKLTE